MKDISALCNIDTDNIKVVYSRQRVKSILIKIVDGSLHILAPYNLAISSLYNLLVAKNTWIQAQLSLHRENLFYTAKQYKEGEIFHYLGEEYPLHIHIAATNAVSIDSKKIHIQVRQPQHLHDGVFIKKLLIKWYREQAQQMFLIKTFDLAERIGVEVNNVIVRSFKARWGSCSRLQQIKYNWHLILAPENIIDYVVTHELCHILEMNHSKKFWQHVASYCPEYKKSRQWLKMYGSRLNLS